MDSLQLLPDTMFRDQAIKIVDRFLEKHGLTGMTVQPTQINGLRQIAIHQPEKVETFASRQRERAQKKLDQSGGKSEKYQTEVAFWKLVAELCEIDNPPKNSWSLTQAADPFLPPHLRQESIPSKSDCPTSEDRRRRIQLVQQRKEKLRAWMSEHIPVFFRWFCVEYLYRKQAESRRRR